MKELSNFQLKQSNEIREQQFVTAVDSEREIRKRRNIGNKGKRQANRLKLNFDLYRKILPPSSSLFLLRTNKRGNKMSFAKLTVLILTLFFAFATLCTGQIATTLETATTSTLASTINNVEESTATPTSDNTETTIAPTTTTTTLATSLSNLSSTTNEAAAAAATTTPTATTSTTTTTTTTEQTKPNSNGKYPPVNFTQVEQVFNLALEDSEVIQKWRKMDKTLTEGVRAILKIVFPHIVSMASDAKVSGNCSGAILKWILNLRNMREWAVKMLDAIGKPQAGILEGSLTLFGNYKQCLRVRAPDEDEIELTGDDEFREYFRGQYCVLQIKPALPKKRPFYSLNSTINGLLRKSYKYYEKNVYDDLAELAMAFNFVSIRADLCVPSLCSRDDIQRVADYLVRKVEMRAKVQRCDTERMDSEGSLIEQSHLLWSMIFIILFLLVTISTLTSTLIKLNSKRASSGNGGGKLSGAAIKSKSILTSMSVYRSLSHMKNVHMDRINDSKPIFLYSLRLLLILWIFLVSLTSQLDFQYLRELLSLRNVIMQWPMQLLVNSSLQFDALILLTAFTYSYQNINSNLIDLVKYNASKYSRLMPSIMLFVALTIITPLLYQNRSPVWRDFVDEPAQVCKSNGFVNLFFLQNLLSSNQICLPQTWIFCVELQLCILSIPIVYMLNKRFDTHQGRFSLTSGPVLILLALTLIGCLINFQNVYRNSLPAAWFLTFPDKADRNIYFSLHLFKTWSHLTTFSVGLFTGHLCRCLSLDTFSGRPYGRKCCDNLMWFTSLTIMSALIFSTHSWSLNGSAHLDSPLLCALYASLAPLLWSISWSLILFLLTVPKADNNKHHQQQQQHRCQLIQLLTNDVNLVRIGRLSFLAYLINPYVNNFVLAVQEQAIFSSILMLGHTFLGNLIITFTLAFIVSALVELPCRRLIKKLLIGSRRQSTNFDIIARQLNICPNHNHGTNSTQMHDSYATPNARNHNGTQSMMSEKQLSSDNNRGLGAGGGGGGNSNANSKQQQQQQSLMVSNSVF